MDAVTELNSDKNLEKEGEKTTKEENNSTKETENSTKDKEISTKDKENSTKDKENSTKDKENSTEDKENTTKDKDNSSNDKENATKDVENSSKDKDNATKQAEVSSANPPDSLGILDLIAVKPGYACIKKQYIVPKEKKEPKAKESQDESPTEEGEPRAKKQKLKGCNKNRPRSKRIEPADKMCPAIVNEEPCPYGDSCKFQHDVAKFMASKIPDVSDDCYVFKTYGRCPCGVRCRFASCHVDENLKNVVNEELYEKRSQKEETLNTLTKDLQKLLWKKKYNFDKADLLISKNFQFLSVDDKVQSGFWEVAWDDGHLRCVSVIDLKDQNIGQIAGKPVGCITNEDVIKLRPSERKKIDFAKKLYLAPLTTVGNLPFRRLCKRLGAEVTCGEMALATSILQGKQPEWSLIKRHASEDIFGVQICGAFPDTMTRCAQLLNETAQIDFLDINCGCPIDLIYQKGAGSALLDKPNRLERIVKGMTSVLDVPLTVKLRTGITSYKNVAHHLLPRLRDWGVSLASLHGRSREQRYTRLADWEYIHYCSQMAEPMPLFGCGDILSYEEYYNHLEHTGVSGIMIGRGALIKPWIFTEIKERRHWDISSSERLDILKDFSNYGLEHWGSDYQGVENTRRFLLEWLSFACRYIPVGLLERPPQKINERPPQMVGRDDLETLMCSYNCADWVKISEMLLGPVPEDFKFLPKHKANSFA